MELFENGIPPSSEIKTPHCQLICHFENYPFYQKDRHKELFLIFRHRIGGNLLTKYNAHSEHQVLNKLQSTQKETYSKIKYL